MSIVDRNLQSCHFILHSRTLGYDSLKGTLLQQPASLLIVPIGEGVLVQFDSDSLTLAGLKEYLGETFQFFLGSTELAFRVADINLHYFSSSNSAGILDDNRNGDRKVFC